MNLTPLLHQLNRARIENEKESEQIMQAIRSLRPRKTYTKRKLSAAARARIAAAQRKRWKKYKHAT